MSHQKLQEMFGLLRQWLNVQTIDHYWVAAFLPFLKEAYATSPDAYIDQWVPYLSQRRDLWRQCLFYTGFEDAKDTERMSLLNQVAPFIQYHCSLSEYVRPNAVYQATLKALEQEVGEVRDFLFELDDLVPASFAVVRQATFLGYSLSFSESAQLGSEQSGYVVLDWEVAGPQALFDVFIRGTFPNLRRLELYDDYDRYVDVTPLFDAMVESPNHQHIKHLYVFDEPSDDYIEESGLDEKMHPRVDASRPICTTHTPALHLFGVNPALFFNTIKATSLRFELEGFYIEGPSAMMLSDVVAALPWFGHLEHFGVHLQSWDMDGVDALIALLGDHPRDWQTMLFSTESPLPSSQIRRLLSRHTSSLKQLAISHSSPQDLQWIATQCTSLDYLELSSLSEPDARIILNSELAHLKMLNLQKCVVYPEVQHLLSQSEPIQEALRAGGSGKFCWYTSP